jgi:phosphatidylinositol alpha-1,6-mannosyltransferase
MTVKAHRSLAGKDVPWDIFLEVDAYLPWSGGSRTYYHNLYRRLADDFGCRVLVNTSHCAGEESFDREASNSNFAVCRAEERLPDWKAKRAPALARKLLRTAVTCAKTMPRAVHCGDLFPQDLAGALLRRFAKLPLLIFVHGDEITQTDGRRLQPRVRDAVYRTADALVAANSLAYDRLAGILGSSDRITMITPGVDFQIFSPGHRPEWIQSKFSLGVDPVLLTVGRLVKKKGHETVLRSLPVILKEFPQLRYLIVGEGPERIRLEELTIRYGLTRCVTFVGNVPHSELGDYYRAADIFCMVNQSDQSGDIESFGMVFIEANATAKPVIGGRSGGTAQSIAEGETGLLCDPGNASQAAAQLLLLLRNSDLRARMGNAGLARARQNFDWASRASQLFDVHQRIARTLKMSNAVGGHSCIPLR